MTAGSYNFTIELGATFNNVITWRDEDNNLVDITGYSARMQCRPGIESPTIIFSLTDLDGLTLGDAAGTITINIPATDSVDITYDTGYYDLELESPSGFVTRLLSGIITFSKEVTR